MSNQRDPNKRQIGGYVSKELKRQLLEVAKRRSLATGRDVSLIEVIVDYVQVGLSEEATKAADVIGRKAVETVQKRKRE
jgi:hypothetical protein